jgi:lysophospholipase L1-like esterase
MKKPSLFLKAVVVLLLCSQAALAKTVCMVGDSVVKRGGHWRHHMAQLAPFQYLGNYQDDPVKTGYPYWHDGVGGNTTVDVLNRIEVYTDQNGNQVPPIPVCDITILHVGGNDLGKLERRASAIANNVLDIANRLKNRGSFVYVGTILPCNGCDGKDNEAIVWTNFLIKRAVKDFHPVLDHWKAILDSNCRAADLYQDPFHPKDLGYFVLANYDLSILAPETAPLLTGNPICPESDQ